MTESNGTTAADATTYHEVLPANRLETALWLECDRMAFLLDHMNEQTLEIQKRVVQSEWRLRGGESPTQHVDDAVLDALYPPGHPYRRNRESPDDVGAVRLDHARWFFQRWYAPSNATLAIVGHVDPDVALALAQKYFGPIEGSAVAIPPDHDPMEGVPEALPGAADVQARAALLYDYIEYYWRTPRAQAPGDAALDLAASVLRSRLWDAFDNAQIRPRRLGVSQESGERGSIFRVHEQGNLVDPLDRFVEAADRTLADLLAKPTPSPAELRNARRSWLRAHFDLSEGLVGRARFLAENARRHPLSGNRLVHGVTRYRAVGAVGADDVTEAIRAHLGPEHRIRLRVRNDDDAGRGGRIDAWEGARWE